MDHGQFTSVTEFTHIAEMQDELRQRLVESSRRDLGRMDSLRATVCNLVVQENYERATDEMVAYVDLKTAYPNFQERVQRLIHHCTDLIQAIKTKRNFPGLAALSLAKQQEIHEKVIEHFEELKQHLRHIEMVEREHKLDDVRSTVWVLRTAVHATWILMLGALIVDAKNGAFGGLFTVTMRTLDSAAEWIVTLIKIS